jgi:hypothetical protein
MPKTDYTYELRVFAEDAFGIEDYVVRASNGEPVGTVAGLLRRDGQLLLVVERDAPLADRDRRVVRLHDVGDVDHEALAVWLRLPAERLDAADELDPDALRVDGEAEARRVIDLPPDLAPRPEVSPAGPVDRPVVTLLPALGGAVAFCVLVVVAAATAFQTPWVYFGFVVPAAVAVVAAVIALRAWRRPYEPHAAQKP